MNLRNTVLFLIAVTALLMIWPRHQSQKQSIAESATEGVTVDREALEKVPDKKLESTDDKGSPSIPSVTNITPPEKTNDPKSKKEEPPFQPKVKLPVRIKKYGELSKALEKAKYANASDLLDGLLHVNEFRTGATDSQWNGNYYGQIGWAEKLAEGHVKPDPAVINLEFQRPNDDSPLTCLGISHGPHLLRFTKASGAFVPMARPDRDDYFVFRVGSDHYMQILLSEDRQGLAATFYLNDPQKGLVAFSSGVFAKNENPVYKELRCDY